MALTGLDVQLDSNVFSRYEDGRDTITATVTPTFTDPPVSTPATVALVRQRLSGPHALATVTLTFTDATPQAATFALKGITQDGHDIARRSDALRDYSVVASAGDISSTAKLTLLALTPEKLRAEFMFGASLVASEQLAPRLQPQAITGVRVLEMSMDSATGAAALVFDRSTPSLQWSGGPVVTISATAKRRYVLADADTGWIVVEVTSAALPSGDTTETLLIDRASLTDDTMAEQIIRSFDWLERELHIFLEPTMVVSKMEVPDAEWYDRVVDGTTYYMPNRRDEWTELNTAQFKLRKVYALTGWYNQTKSVTVPAEWIKATESNGLIQLVPTAGVPLTWTGFEPIFGGYGYGDFGGYGGYGGYGYGTRTLPDYWHYRLLCGLDGITEELLAFGAHRAAIPLLTMLSQAQNPSGLTSASVSRDGVSESRSINQGGAYAVLIAQHGAATGMPSAMPGRGGKAQRDTGLDALRLRYRGLAMTVL